MIIDSFKEVFKVDQSDNLFFLISYQAYIFKQRYQVNQQNTAKYEGTVMKERTEKLNPNHLRYSSVQNFSFILYSSYVNPDVVENFWRRVVLICIQHFYQIFNRKPQRIL